MFSKPADGAAMFFNTPRCAIFITKNKIVEKLLYKLYIPSTYFLVGLEGSR